MAWTLTSSGAAIVKAGVNANSTITLSGARLAEWSDQVEGRIVAQTRRNWVTGYSSVDAGVQAILDDTASDLIAMKIINWDISSNPSRISETMLDVIRDNANQNMKTLKEFKSNTIKSVD